MTVWDGISGCGCCLFLLAIVIQATKKTWRWFWK